MTQQTQAQPPLHTRPLKTMIVIPARYGSTRLAAKPLADIHGKPMIQWVYERARQAHKIDSLCVATDDQRIMKAVEKFGGHAILTSPELNSGTDRVAAVAAQTDADIYINIQGDLPLIEPQAIEAGLALVHSGQFPMGTLMTELTSLAELTQESVVKVITDQNQRAIYFSRLPIPYSRGPIPAQIKDWPCKKHIGLYVYTRDTLFRFKDLSPSALEKGEVLEQLRALENGIPIGVASVQMTSIEVDTPEDLERVRQHLHQ